MIFLGNLLITTLFPIGVKPKILVKVLKMSWFLYMSKQIIYEANFLISGH